jgi:hypothetical protein
VNDAAIDLAKSCGISRCTALAELRQRDGGVIVEALNELD